VSARPLIFLKIGGSLICDKRTPHSFRAATVRRIGEEIRTAQARQPEMRLVLAHGGGAAHLPAQRYSTREGLAGGGGWRGFALTRRCVLDVNRRVLDSLARAGLYPILLSPSASILARDGRIARWDTSVMERLLSAGQVPLIHGDAVLDARRGFTICSTEEMFSFLADRLEPLRIVLACDVEGVYPYRVFPVERGRTRARVRPAPLERIDRSNFATVMEHLRAGGRADGTGAAHDVTGGMLAKVERLFEIVSRHRSSEGRVVSGLRPGVVLRALLGCAEGTLVRWD